MQLVAVCAVLAAALVPGSLETLDTFCECRMTRHKEKIPGSVVSCKKDLVPESWRRYRYIPGYALVKLSRIYVTWAVGKKICEDEGAQMAVPPDRHAFDGLKQMLNGAGVPYAYIGISDLVTEGLYVGVDGHPAPYLPWQPGQPNNLVFGSNEEDCIDVANNGLINDAVCTNEVPFFCERRLSVGIPDTYVWMDDVSRFYKVHTEKLVYAEAVRVCRSENATLAVPDTWSRVEAVLTVLPPVAADYLVGFTDEAVEGDFVTETGRHLKDMEFQVWGVGEPTNLSLEGKVENCLGLRNKGFYNDLSCYEERPFICEIEPLFSHTVP